MESLLVFFLLQVKACNYATEFSSDVVKNEIDLMMLGLFPRRTD